MRKWENVKMRPVPERSRRVKGENVKMRNGIPAFFDHYTASLNLTPKGLMNSPVGRAEPGKGIVMEQRRGSIKLKQNG